VKSAFDVVDAFTVVGPWRDRQPGVRARARSARAYPGIPFLAGHSGAGDVEVNLEEARRTPNLFLELTYSAGTPWLV
jgi:hypothetical protein